MEITINEVQDIIYSFKGKRVIFDFDLAVIYEVETKVLVQAVKRNIKRFPSDFMFQLSNQELTNLRSQFVTSSWGGRRTPPYAFTEQGVAMLSSVLRSQKAIDVNIQIMRTFVKLREMLSSHSELAKKLCDLETKYDSQFKVVFEAIRQIMAPPPPTSKKRIGFGREIET